jgi:hypothetical protein
LGAALVLAAGAWVAPQPAGATIIDSGPIDETLDLNVRQAR